MSFVPSAADGFASARRENANGFDLNRNFPDPHLLCSPDAAHCDVQVLKRATDVQPEVRAVMRWVLGSHFTASANLHEGALVANYPYDAYPRNNPSGLLSQPGNGGSPMLDTYEQYSQWIQRQAAKGGTAAASVGTQSTGISAAPDHATFVFMARTYASTHKTMQHSTEFPGKLRSSLLMRMQMRPFHAVRLYMSALVRLCSICLAAHIVLMLASIFTIIPQQPSI